MENSVTRLQAYMLLYLSMGFMNHVLIEPVLYDRVGRDAWISASLSIVPLILMLPFIHYIMNNTGDLSLYQWVKRYVGKGIAISIYIPVIAYLLILSSITLKDTNDWLSISYLPITPEIISTIIIVLVCTFAVNSGLRTLAILTGILLPFVLLFGYFVMSANFQYKDYSLLLPILEHGPKPLVSGTFYAWSGLIEIIFLLLLKQHIVPSNHTNYTKFTSLLVFSVFLVGLTIGPLTGGLAEFGAEEVMKMRYPAYEQWRLVQIGKYVEHLDFLSLYQWMSGTIIRISLALFLVLDVIGLNNKRKNFFLLMFISVCLVLISQIPISDLYFLKLFSRIYLPFSVVFAVLYMLVISVLIFVKRRKLHG